MDIHPMAKTVPIHILFIWNFTHSYTFWVKKIPRWYTFDVKMIPIQILGGLKSIPDSSCTSVYTLIMDVTPVLNLIMHFLLICRPCLSVWTKEWNKDISMYIQLLFIFLGYKLIGLKWGLFLVCRRLHYLSVCGMSVYNHHLCFQQVI